VDYFYLTSILLCLVHDYLPQDMQNRIKCVFFALYKDKISGIFFGYFYTFVFETSVGGTSSDIQSGAG
jgi:hypothetical protein